MPILQLESISEKQTQIDSKLDKRSYIVPEKKYWDWQTYVCNVYNRWFWRDFVLFQNLQKHIEDVQDTMVEVGKQWAIKSV